jgi:hypothetical protein
VREVVGRPHPGVSKSEQEEEEDGSRSRLLTGNSLKSLESVLQEKRFKKVCI